MDAVLRQSKAVCPFLKKASPATLRSLSTTSTRASPGGGSMSNLQTIARRCPIMGKALAVQTAKSGKVGLGGVAALGAIRAFTGKVNSGKAKLHTSRSHEARAVDGGLFVRENGALCQLLWIVENFVS
jgi:5-aminolevulinate synthase